MKSLWIKAKNHRKEKTYRLDDLNPCIFKQREFYLHFFKIMVQTKSRKLEQSTGSELNK